MTSAVITVPTNFTEKQRETLIKVVNDAGVEVLQLISEPVAAVLAYDARSGSEVKDKIIVVADLGGTRSDVAVVASRGGMYTILATAHDYEFAGVHLDQVLMDHFAKEFLKKHPKASDPRQNARSLAKLRLEAEATKKALSLGTNASFSVESLVDGIDFAATINRTRYETIARKVLEGVDRLVLGVIKKAGLDVLDIDEVILSGGTSHTPRIATNLRERVFTPATEIQAPSTSPNAINPSELQARGAALQASLIQEYDAEDIEQSTHPAVTTVPHVANAIGAVVIGSAVGDAEEKVFVPIIAAETAVPARRTIRLATPSQGGDALVQIVEGGTHIKVTKPEPKEKTNGTKDDEDDEDDDDFDDDEEEEEEKREKVWKIGKTLAEAVLRGTKKGGEIEITVNVGADNSLTIAVREVGAKGGVRGTVKAP